MMLPHYTSTKDMSNRQIEILIHELQSELMDRQIVSDCEYAFNNHLYIGEVDEAYRGAYISYLRDNLDNELAQDIIDEWNSQLDRIQSMQTTGA